MWYFGSKVNPNPREIQTCSVQCLHSDTKIAGVSQPWMFAAKQVGISEVLADLVPLTAEILIIANHTGTKPAGAWTLTGWY